MGQLPRGHLPAPRVAPLRLNGQQPRLHELNLRLLGDGLPAGQTAQQHCHVESCEPLPPRRPQRCQGRRCAQGAPKAVKQREQVALEGAWPAACPIPRVNAGSRVGQPGLHTHGRARLRQQVGGGLILTGPGTSLAF